MGELLVLVSVPSSKTNSFPPSQWLEDETFLLKWPLERGHVSFRDGVTISKPKKDHNIFWQGNRGISEYPSDDSQFVWTMKNILLV